MIVRENKTVADGTINHEFSDVIASLEKEKIKNQVRVFGKKDIHT